MIARLTARPLAAALLAGLAIAPAFAQSRTPSITVATAERAEIRETVILTGSFVAREEVLIYPEIDGFQVIEILVEEGDRVAAGQVLARLNREALDVQATQNAAQIARAEAAIAAARANIQEAVANKRLADEQLGRTQSLQRTGVATNDQLDQRLTAARAAEARLVASQNQLRVSEADLVLAREQRRDIELRIARTEIRARTAGVVSRRSVRLGGMSSLNPLTDAMFRIIAEGAVELEADAAESALARLRVGQPAVIEGNGHDGVFEGRVRLIAPEVNRTNRLGRVRVAIQGDERPPLGSFGRAGVEIARTVGVLVPLSAVFVTPRETSVQVVRDGVVETRYVIAGLRAEGRMEIREGLAEGEQVVAVSGTFVRNGDRVTPVLAQPR